MRRTVLQSACVAILLASGAPSLRAQIDIYRPMEPDTICTKRRCGLFFDGHYYNGLPADSGHRVLVSESTLAHPFSNAVDTALVARELRDVDESIGRERPFDIMGLISMLGVIEYSASEPAKRPWGGTAEVFTIGSFVGMAMLAGRFDGRAADASARAAWDYSRPARDSVRTDGCSYERCALRIHADANSMYLVRGATGERVLDARALFASAGDSAKAHYARYLATRQRGSVRETLVVTLLAGALVMAHINNKAVHDAAVAPFALGFIVGVTQGSADQPSDAEYLDAILFYNRDLGAGR